MKPSGGNPWWGAAWILWCAFSFFVVLVGGSALFEREVLLPYCADACAEAGLRFDRYRVGGRSGPSSACMCEGEHAIETGLADGGTFCAAMGFLACCYGPIGILSLRDRRRRAGRRGMK